MTIAKTFNRVFEPENKKNAFKIFYLVGAGSTFFGTYLSVTNGMVLEGLPFIGAGTLSMALGFDYRMERLEQGMDKIREQVE